MSSMNILSIDRITPPAGPYPSPGVTIPLSLFDALWVILPPVQLLFLYPEYSDNASSLKTSLSETLLNFHSLTGTLTYMPTTADVIIDCRRELNNGISFTEAECDIRIDAIASDPIHDVDTFDKLVPVIDVDVLPMPVLAVQVTRFPGGGAAIGVAFHHAAMDGKGMWQFLEAWSRSCRGEGFLRKGVGPMNDRSVVKGQGGGEEVAKRFIRELGPALPNTKIPGLPVHSRPQLMRRTFSVSAIAIETIKQHIMNETKDAYTSDPPPSRFSALAAHIWVCIAHARAIMTDDVSTFAFCVDCRPHLNPQIAGNYTGNCLKPQYAKMKWSKLQMKNGLVGACIEINRAIEESRRDPLKGHEEWANEFLTLPPMTNRWYVGMSPRFMAYETDFGWGRPERVEVISVGVDGDVELLCGREVGAMQVSVALSPHCMDKFVQKFEKGLSIKKSSLHDILLNILH